MVGEPLGPVSDRTERDKSWKSKVEAKGKPGDESGVLWRTLKQRYLTEFSEWKMETFDESFLK